MIVSIAVDDAGWNAIPGLEELTRSAVEATLASVSIEHENLETTFLFTNDDAVSALNAKWRGQAKPTDVLSFPAKTMKVPKDSPQPFGDVVLALGVVTREAAEQGKTLPQHATHLIVHGLLHLLGYDHGTDEDAARMQEYEIRVLKELGIPNPYER